MATDNVGVNLALKAISAGHPDYQNFTVNDFSKFEDFEIRTVLGMFATKQSNREVLIPQSFVRTYGDNAAGEMILAVEREAARRNQTELYATAILNGGFGSHAGATKPVQSDVPATIDLLGNITVQSTAPKILNYQVAQNATLQVGKNETARQKGTYVPQTSFDVVIPQSVVEAVVNANPQIPAVIATKSFNFPAGDELAFMSGYATRAGASSDIGPVTMQFPASAACAIPKMVGQIFDKNKSDIDAALAWVAGYIQRDVDQMPPVEKSQALATCPSATKTALSR